MVDLFSRPFEVILVVGRYGDSLRQPIEDDNCGSTKESRNRRDNAIAPTVDLCNHRDEVPTEIADIRATESRGGVECIDTGFATGLE
jgi:hypothetical protein